MKGDRQRRDRLMDAMRRDGLDALVCCAASDILLLTGYWPVMGMSLAILSSGGDCVVVLPEDEQEMASRYSSDPQISFKPETLTSLEPLSHVLRDPLRQALAQTGCLGGRLAVRAEITEQPSSYVVVTNFHQAMKTLLENVSPGSKILHADELLETEKDAKTPVELEKMDRAASIVRTGFAAAPNVIEPGLTEREVAAKIQLSFDQAPEAEQVLRSYGSFYCMSGPNSAKAAAAFAHTRDRKLEKGDLVMIHANTCADGFWTDVTRTYTVGEPSQRQQEMRDAILKARKAGLDAIRPGVPAREVDRAARDVMSAHGLGKAFKHPAGHGVGFAAANAAGRPRIHPLSPDVLQAGSTFNLEPAAYFDGYGGMRHCDLLAVTEDGVRVLTAFQQDGVSW